MALRPWNPTGKMPVPGTVLNFYAVKITKPEVLSISITASAGSICHLQPDRAVRSACLQSGRLSSDDRERFHLLKGEQVVGVGTAALAEAGHQREIAFTHLTVIVVHQQIEPDSQLPLCGIGSDGGKRKLRFVDGQSFHFVT